MRFSFHDRVPPKKTGRKPWVNKKRESRAGTSTGKGGGRKHEVELRGFVDAIRECLGLMPLYTPSVGKYNGPQIYHRDRGSKGGHRYEPL